MKYPLLFALATTLLSLPVWAQTEPTPKDDLETSIETDYPNRRIYFGEPNPASFAFYGSGRIQMPSLRFDIGSTLSTDQAIQDVLGLTVSFQNLFGQLGSSQSLDAQASQAQADVESFLKQFQGGARLGYDLDYNILGFGGTPLAQVQIANRPLSLGLHLGASGRGYIEANFSDEFTTGLSGLTASIPSLVNTGSTVAQISSQAGTLVSSVNSLNNNINEMTSIATAFINNPLSDTQGQINAFTSKMSEVDNQIDALLPTARGITGLVDDTTGAAKSLLTAFGAFTGGGVQVTAVNDLHVTLGLSGAYPIFESEDIKVSLGTRLKLFMLPYNVPMSQFGFQTNAGLLGKLELNEVTGLQNTQDLNATLDAFSAASKDISGVIDAAEKVSASVDLVEQDLKKSNNSLSSLASGNGVALLKNANEFSSSVSTAISSTQQAASEVSTVQQTLLSGLEDIKLKGAVTTPAGAGFGMDFGLDALLFKHLRLGLMLQNPVVLWPGTETPFEAAIKQVSGQTALQPDLIFDNAKQKAVNYNASVPFSILLNGRYRFDDLLPEAWSGFYAHSMLEFVFNGRKPAFMLGARKMFDEYFYLGLGGRAGGLGSLLYFETGVNPLHGFALDLQVGISPTGNGLPAQNMGWLGMTRLGLAYRF